MIKEYGSDFHFFQTDEIKSKDSLYTENSDSLFFSGRVALYNLLDYGIKNYGWKMVGFPSYYCHEVVDFCKSLSIEICYYQYNPFQPKSFSWQDDDKHVFINVDFFGISMMNTNFLKKSIVIEDLSNNLLKLCNSSANYCFASLRKQLPIAAGGICKNLIFNLNTNHHSNQFSENVASEKIAAMLLKAKYLNGEFKDKEEYRNLYMKSEKSFSDSQTNSNIPESVKNIFLSLPHKELILKTRSNINLVKSLFKPNTNFRLLTNSQNTEMGLMLIFETQHNRNLLKKHLIEKHIYPSILWPNQKTAIDKFFENRVLFLHADFRYNSNDIHFITNQLNSFDEYV